MLGAEIKTLGTEVFGTQTKRDSYDEFHDVLNFLHKDEERF
jgi:hypothetical protein